MTAAEVTLKYIYTNRTRKDDSFTTQNRILVNWETKFLHVGGSITFEHACSIADINEFVYKTAH